MLRLGRRDAYVLVFAVAMSGYVGCRAPNQLTVYTSQETSEAGQPGLVVPMPEIHVQGMLHENPNNSPGTSESYDGWTQSTKTLALAAYYIVNDPIVPAGWDHQAALPLYCSTDTDDTSEYLGVVNGYEIFERLNYLTKNNAGILWFCNVPAYDLPEASSRFALAGNIPSSVTLTGLEPFSTAYGMPIMYVFSGTDGSPNLVTTITASSVDPSGATATFPLPGTLAQSAYGFMIENATPDGGYTPNSFNLYSVAGSQTIQGNPFGVAAQVVSTSWQSATNPDPYGDGTCAGQWTYDSGSSNDPFPVVTQYSLDQVSNGASTIVVGPNPTAIALYDSQQTQNPDQDNGPCNTYQSQTTQMTRAIVANSGNNTVSILDLVNNAVLDNITVGNQPVALALSADGSTAYVANYSDSTVTEVNLNTDTPVTTVAVAGQPTSVTLTAGGVLWVGGVGFLAEINPQNMSVVATQSTRGETISALGYSDTEGELVATTTDSTGNVNIDEVAPVSVQTNTPYTAVASHQVSTMGSYFSPRTQTMVRGFTGTLSQSTIPIDSNLPGAPPLVVQDGWAAVTATPTGFSITDTSGHVVLASETTPSPVAAIAVDTNLNIAYLTMPDSNTLLTVPLPGTGGSQASTAFPSFTLAATNDNPSQTALSLGHSMSYTVNVSPSNGFTGNVALSVAGLPAGVTATFSPSSIQASGSATLTLTSAYSASTFIGSSTVTVTGIGGGVIQSAPISLTTQPLQYRGQCSVQ